MNQACDSGTTARPSSHYISVVQQGNHGGKTLMATRAHLATEQCSVPFTTIRGILEIDQFVLMLLYMFISQIIPHPLRTPNATTDYSTRNSTVSVQSRTCNPPANCTIGPLVTIGVYLGRPTDEAVHRRRESSASSESFCKQRFFMHSLVSIEGDGRAHIDSPKASVQMTNYPPTATPT